MSAQRIALIGPDRSSQALLALSLERVRADLTTYSTLLHAPTFGAVRADDYASQLANTSLEMWAQRLQDEDPEVADLAVEEVLALRARDEDPFPDAEQFFGEDWHGWRPEPRLLTADWLEQAVPEALRWLGRDDQGWGFDYESSPWIALEDAGRLRELLEQRGYDVVEVTELAAAYDDAPRDVDAWLADARVSKSVAT